MKKRLLSILLTVVMVLSLLPTAAFAVTVDNTYQPGTYVASAPGHDDALVSVTLTLAQQDETVVISDLQADGSTQTPRFWAMVEEAGLLDSIRNANGTTGVDVVSGATQSSRAVLSAVEQALSQATSTLSGSGTASDPYQIVTAAQLTAFAAAVDGGNTYAGQYVALGASIDLSGIDSWNPIGTEEGAAVFQGTFDGRGYTISGLTINASVTAGDSYHGLFSVLGSSAVVRNLNLAGADVHVENTSGKAYAGALAGATTKPATSAHSVIGTRIDVCSATGSVSALTSGDALVYAGGMIGFGQIGTAITNCWTDVNVSAVANNTNKNSMAGGIIGSSGNYAVVANCAAFGNVYAASPASTNFGGMAGGLVGMMAGKQYTSYAAGDITIANGGLTKDHHWVGALDGQVTTSGTTGGTAYPAEGAARSANYYAEDAVLKEEIYENNGATLKNTVTDEPADRGFSTQQGYDKVMVSTAVARPVMASADFAETLNGNIREINGILAAYGITGIALCEWQLEGGRVLPTGAVWTSGDISDSIFAGGSGTEGDPYLIATEEQLRDFAASLTSKIDYTGKYVALANDISVSSAAWTPIGGSQYLFNDTFDGRGYTINGLTLGAEDKPFALDSENLYIGLFGILGAKAVVKNVNLTNVAFYTTYAATAYLGGIAGITQGSTTSGDYTGGLVDRMTAYDAAGYAAIADGLNASFAAFPIDITAYGIDSTALKTWTYDAGKNLVTFGAQSATVTYVQPDCEKVEKPEQTMQDGVWYGRDDGKTTVVKITVKNNAVTKTEVLSGESSGEAYEAALAKAKYKAIYGDFSHYEQADPSRFAGGSGTEKDPYRIANEAQLRYLAESINADVDWKGVCFKQTADIKLTGGDWLPIGWSLNGEVNGKKTLICAYPFRGKTA